MHAINNGSNAVIYSVKHGRHKVVKLSAGNTLCWAHKVRVLEGGEAWKGRTLYAVASLQDRTGVRNKRGVRRNTTYDEGPKVPNVLGYLQVDATERARKLQNRKLGIALATLPHLQRDSV